MLALNINYTGIACGYCLEGWLVRVALKEISSCLQNARTPTR